MSLLKLILKIASPVPEIENYSRFLFIGPHPDDIEIGAGATAARLASEGKNVCFLICTDGRYGDGFTDLRGDELVECRKKESADSARMLGVTDIRFLNLSDGGFYEYGTLVEGIAKTVGEFKPDVIFAPDPCVTSECHPDHLNAGKAARQIACFAPYPGIMAKHAAESSNVKAIAYYFTAKANHYIKTKGFFETQQQSIFSCHKSQFPENSAEGKSIALYLKLRSVSYGIRVFKGQAEAFRVLSQTHMHCFPEAGY